MTLLGNVAIVAAIVAALTAALMGELRHILELRRGRRKALNKVLWCQLDLWFELKRFDVTGALELIAPGLVQRWGVTDSQPLPADTIAITGETLAETFLNTRDPELDQKYTHAVEELASYEPVLAHSLSGRTALQRYREQVDAYMNLLAIRLPGDQPDSAAMSGFVAFMRSEVLRAVVEIMENDIAAVAARLNRSTRKQLRSAMRDFRDRVSQDGGRSDAVMQRLMNWAATQTPTTDTPVQANS
jgi:hypothetical protein